MNSVCLIGRITKDIELRYTESGLACVSMFIAINNGKDKDGNEKQADFPKIYVYDKQAENLEKYCHKGSQVAITGRLKTRSWEREDGSRAYETYVMANRVNQHHYLNLIIMFHNKVKQKKKMIHLKTLESKYK